MTIRRHPFEVSVPAELWARPEMLDALDRRDLGVVFRLVRRFVGASQTWLGERLGGVAQADISVIERGKRQVVELAFFERVADGLELPASARLRLGLAPTGRGTTGDAMPALVTPRCACEGGSHRRDECPVRRRQLLAATAASAVVLARPAAGPGRLGHDDVRRSHDFIRSLFAADHRSGGDGVRGAAVEELRRLRTALTHGTYREPVGRDLRSCVGHLGEMAGWLSFEACRPNDARAFYGRALTAAHTVDDGELRAFVLTSMGLLEEELVDDPAEALALYRAAQATSGSRRSPRLRSILAAREATALARLGDGPGSARALSTAWQELDRADAGADELEWGAFHGPAELYAAEGKVALLVDEPVAAEPALRRSLAAVRPDHRRNRALYGTRLAEANLAAGEREQALAAGLDALTAASGVTSSRVHGHLRQLGRRLAREAPVEGLDEFTAGLAGVWRGPSDVRPLPRSAT